MPRLSLGLGVQNIRKVGGGAAPSGLPVASTPSIVVVGSGGVPSATYNKKEEEDYIGNVGIDLFYAGPFPLYNKSPDAFPNTDVYFLIAPNATVLDFDQSTIYTNTSNWRIIHLFDNEGSTFDPVATNPSTNVDYIPTSGWTPSITITAA